eukprot:GHRQ01034804.1.p1 GENE.GHRQ01034804.1~~GHRQ01034804.1.p1  ORF type:complete len:171 (+),score=4.68 GHRQ01034804.1:48-560(+)
MYVISNLLCEIACHSHAAPSRRSAATSTMPHPAVSSRHLGTACMQLLLGYPSTKQASPACQLLGEEQRSPAGCRPEGLGESQLPGDVQPPHAPDLHAQHALVQPGDDLARAHAHVKGRLAQAVLKLAALRVHGDVVDHHLVALDGLRPCRRTRGVVLGLAVVWVVMGGCK